MLDTDTFFTAVYTVLDDLYRTHLAATRTAAVGRPPRVSDSEVLTLLLLGHFYRLSERQLVRRARAEWRAYFPDQLTQSAFNRRGRALSTVLAWLVPQLATLLEAASAPYEVLDGTAVPVAQPCRGTRSHLFGLAADVGRGGVGKGWYYGVKLLLSVTPQGTITGFVAGPASTEERWLAEALFAGRAQPLDAPWVGYPPHARRPATGKPYVGPNGPLWPRLGVGQQGSGAYLGDLGYAGEDWAAAWQARWGARVVTKAAYPADDAVAQQAHASLRQIVETVNGALKGDFALALPGAKTLVGLQARIAAKLASCNLGIVLNRHYGRPPLAFATLAA
jgi:hypothetical protein